MGVSRNIKVGAFVLAGLIVTFALIFVIGQERNMFSSKVDYKAIFDDVEGLRRGSSVRMGGVDIGTVTDVAYSEDANDVRIYVMFDVVGAEARRIRTDSAASIEGKGLLGDKMIVITAGSPKSPPLPPGSVVKSERGSDFGDALKNVASISAKADQVLENLNRTTGALSDEQFTNDVRAAVGAMSRILVSVDTGEGYVSRLLHDPKEADRISNLVGNLEQSSARLERTLASVDSVLNRVEKGPGFAHDVIYGDGPSQAVAQFGNAADELRLTLKGIREGNGIAHSVIYGDEGSEQLMGNLNGMSADLRQILADVRAGKGTIGALLVDPSIYEDLKVVLGNVERNKTLRALVRYSIKRDERAPTIQDRDPAPAVPPRPPGTVSATDTVPVGKSGP